MGTKCKINIQLNQKEYALVHYEMEFGRNKTIKNQAKVLYYAHQGTDTITELCKKTENCYRTVIRILKLYETMGTDAIYQCKRGKRIHHLEQISDELEAYFDENPLKDVPDAVRKIKENFGIPITATPVRYWQRLFVQKVKKHTCKSKHKSAVAFPEQYSFTTFKHGKKRLNDTIVLQWSAFDIWVSWWNSDIVCDGLERLRKRYPDQYLYKILDNAAYQHCRKVRDKAEK